MSERVPILYIGSYGRSGSTLVERVLGQIPSFFAVGELRHIWERSLQENQLCGCGQPFLSCEFWRAVGDEAFGGWDKIDSERVLALKRQVDRLRHVPHHAHTAMTGRRSRTMSGPLREYGHILERLYRAIRICSGAEIIVDSSKDPSYAFMLNILSFVDLRLAHIVRDSRAVAYSWSRRRLRPEIKEREEYMPRFSPAKSALEWNLYNYSLGTLRRPEASSLLIRYEDFVQEPASLVRKILAGLEFDANRSVPYFDGRELCLKVNHTVSGNPMRFYTGKLLLQPDEEWSVKIGSRDRTLVTTLTFHLLRRYGYLDGVEGSS